MALLPETQDWLVCTACGTQFPTPDRAAVTTCFICDDPRQFTPPTGQCFTTLRDMLSRHGGDSRSDSDSGRSSSSSSYQNVFHQYEHDDRVTFIHTTPKVAIGQRCALIATPAGNILWDCVTLLDDATVARITALGGISAIVISHPHYYSTHLLWARTFDCKVYLAAEDSQWLAQRDPARQVLIPAGEVETDILSSGVKALKLGGHFPGSLVLLAYGRLLVADTLVTTPAGLGRWSTDALGRRREGPGAGHLRRPQGMNTFAFMWSIPNMIPVSPADIAQMWNVLSRHEFTSTHGAFMGQDIEDAGIKRRVLESMQIQIRSMGWPDHDLLAIVAH